MIVLNEVSKSYLGKVFALKNLTVEIADGEFVFLIGPSGAGKSTLLKLITRELIPTKGKVYVDEWDVSKLQTSQIFQLRRMVGMVFQDFKILNARTVYENVAIALEILGKKEDEIKREVKDVLELVGLSSKHAFFPQQLSAGEQQRVSLARAIVGGPSILLADEPTGNLDPKTASGIIDILYEVNKIGTTVIIATHNETLVDKMQKRTIALRGGELVSDIRKGRYQFQKSDSKKTSSKREKKK